jgi:hypothetical protein
VFCLLFAAVDREGFVFPGIIRIAVTAVDVLASQRISRSVNRLQRRDFLDGTFLFLLSLI